MLYFGYGSNLSLRDFDRWCAERGFAVELLRPVEAAWLPDRALAFRYRSPVRGGGALDIRTHEGAMVPGMLFEVACGGMDALDQKEGVHLRHYHRAPVRVRTLDGSEREVVTYKVHPDSYRPFTPPTPEYARVVREGLRDYGLPEAPFDAAVRDAAPPPAGPLLQGWRTGLGGLPMSPARSESTRFRMSSTASCRRFSP